MMKVCHMISGDLWAGAEVMALNLFRELQQYDDLTLSVIILNDGRLADEAVALGLSVNIVDEEKGGGIRHLTRCKKIVKDFSPDIIHSHRYKENLFASFLSMLCPGTNLITTQHGMPETTSEIASCKSRALSRANLFALKRRFDTVVAVSDDIRRMFLERHRFDKNKVRVIRNGINVVAQVSQRSFKGHFVIGSAGRLSPIKDFPLFVEIARNVLSKSENFRFELAGDGPEYEKIQRLIKEYGIEDKFILKGFVDDMDSFYQGLDLYLNTSVHEGIPMTILEAMGHGIPVVAADVGGVGEVIDDGIDGFLVRSRCPGDYVEKCLRFMDASLRERMNSSVQFKISNLFSSKSMAHQYYLLYEQLSYCN